MAATDAQPVIVYVAAQLPKRSETFVYREVLGLRARGRDIVAVSVNPPALEEALGFAALEELAREAVVVYGKGWVWRGLMGAMRHPGVMLGALRDAFTTRDVRHLRGRLKIIAQAVGALSVARRLKREGITHVHAHMAHVPTTVAMYLAQALRVRFSFTGHAADLFRDRQMLGEKLRRAAFVSCISEWHRGFYRGVVGGLSDARLPVVRCGVPVESSGAVSGGRSGASLRSAPAWGGEEKLVLAVGRLVPKKGFDVLLRAWAWLRDERQLPAGWRLVIVGDGPEGDALARLTAELKLGDEVRLAGTEPNDRVLERMRACDVFTLPCREAADGDRDGIPVVLMEAMAAGVPVVCGDLETIRELVDDKNSGLLVEPGSVIKLAQALSVVLNSGAERQRMGQAARARVAEEFSLGGNLDRLEAAFASATAAGGESGSKHG